MKSNILPLLARRRFVSRECLGGEHDACDGRAELRAEARPTFAECDCRCHSEPFGLALAA